MKLLYTKRSPYARKIRIGAMEKKIKLDLIEQDLNNKSPELLAANPLGKIPTLITDDGIVLSDSSLICSYFDEVVPEPALLPQGRRQLIVQNLDQVAKGLSDVIVAMFYEKIVRHPENPNEKFISAVEQTVDRSLRYFDNHVEDLKDVNWASISLACTLGYLNFRFLELWQRSKCDKLKQWYEEINKRKSFLTTIPVA